MSPRRTVGYVKLEWTCPNCNTRNPGPQKTCVNCGAPQPDNVQFERAADEQLVADAALRAARAGADFICPYCGTRNKGDARVCVQCGGDLAEARRRVAGEELQPNIGPKTVACANCGAVNPIANVNCPKCGAPLPRFPSVAVPVAAVGSGAAEPRAPKKTNWLLFGGIGAALLVCCAAILFLFVFPTASLKATVSDVHWQTSVPLQEQREVRHTNEEGNPPGDAYDVSCHTESHQVCQEKVIDRGNGYGEKVQDCQDQTSNYCSYTVKEWETVQTYTLDGHDFSPMYSQPTVSLDQRLGSQSVNYTVFFDTQKGPKTYSAKGLDDFKRFQVGSTWTLKLNAIGAVVGVGP